MKTAEVNKHSASPSFEKKNPNALLCDISEVKKNIYIELSSSKNLKLRQKV